MYHFVYQNHSVHKLVLKRLEFVTNLKIGMASCDRTIEWIFLVTTVSHTYYPYKLKNLDW